MVGFCFYGRYLLLWSFHIWYEVTINCLLQFNAIIFLALPESTWLKLYSFNLFCFQGIAKNHQQCLLWTEMKKSNCGNCGISVTKQNLSRHKLSCSGGTLYCPTCSNFFTKSKENLYYHFAIKHSVPTYSKTYKCNLCHAEFPSFCALRQHNNTQHGTQSGSGASTTDVEDIVEVVDDQSLREELESCKHFSTNTERENGRHRVFNFALSSFETSLLNDKLDYVFKELNCAAKVNLAFGFVLKKVEDGMCRYFHAHENNTIMQRSTLLCTQVDMTNLKDRMQKMDIVDFFTGGRANTKWKFYKLT